MICILPFSCLKRIRLLPNHLCQRSAQIPHRPLSSGSWGNSHRSPRYSPACRIYRIDWNTAPPRHLLIHNTLRRQQRITQSEARLPDKWDLCYQGSENHSFTWGRPWKISAPFYPRTTWGLEMGRGLLARWVSSCKRTSTCPSTPSQCSQHYIRVSRLFAITELFLNPFQRKTFPELINCFCEWNVC